MVNKSKLWQYIDFRVRVNLNDKRIMVGNLIAFDKHMNLVLSDTDEIRRIKPKNKEDPEREIKRTLGLIIIRGENATSLIAEAPPHYLTKGVKQNVSLEGNNESINRPNLVTNKESFSNNFENPNGIGNLN